MGKDPFGTRMEEWQRQWEAMRTEGKNPDEFWKKKWVEWQKERLANKNQEFQESPHVESKMDKIKSTDGRMSEEEFWKKAWDSHKEGDKWKEPGPFMGPYFQKQWTEMRKAGKSPDEFWADMWEEFQKEAQKKENNPMNHENRDRFSFRRTPPWMDRKFQERWEEMEKSGKSPADFWKSVKDDIHTDEEKATLFSRFMERHMNKKLDEYIQKEKSPEEMWEKWGGKHRNGRCGWFGSRSQPDFRGGEWKPWMFQHGEHGGMGRGYGGHGHFGGGAPTWGHGFGEHGCPFRRRHDFMRKEYDERPIFTEFDF